MFEPGTFSGQVRERAQHAFREGALAPIDTECELVEDAGIGFLLRVARQLALKERASQVPSGGNRPNPFLPYDPRMHVVDLSSSHVCLLNKFPVVDHHVLVVTTQFELQEAPLNLNDFTALCACISDGPWLAFYNSAALAGASQPHKHMQIVPLPLGPLGDSIPVEKLLLGNAPPAGSVITVAGLPFAHAYCQFPLDGDAQPSARKCLKLYARMLRFLHMDPRASKTAPYNLLMTTRWMLLVPRREERFHSVALNALAFAGALFARDRHQAELLKHHGPMTALRHVALEQARS